MRAAREEGLHDNGAVESRKFRVLTADVENIYLTESEIRAIAALDLSKNRHKGCCPRHLPGGELRRSASATSRPSTKATSARWKTDSRSSTSSSRRPATTSSFRSAPSCRPSWRSTTTSCRGLYEQKVNHLIGRLREAGITRRSRSPTSRMAKRRAGLVEKCDLVKTPHGTPQRRNKHVSGGDPDHRHHKRSRATRPNGSS